MKLLRSLLALGTAAALGLAPIPSYAEDPVLIAGEHVDSGLHLQIDGYGRYGTFTYAVLPASGPAVTAYCLDLDAHYRKGSGLQETGWTGAPAAAPNAEQINWLLHQSYPFVPLEEIWPGAGFNEGLSAQEAVAATQAAVWHYTNGIAITTADVIGSAAEQQDVFALYAHLTGQANIGASEIPDGSLSITSDGRGGRAGERIGPLTVVTTDPATLTIEAAPPGVQLVDAEGAAITGAVASTEVYLEVPADAPAGSVTINATATAEAPTGRIFMPVKGDPESATQPLVAAAVTEHPMLATITIPWKAAPGISTLAKDEADGDKQVLPGGVVQDVVSYAGFTAGEKYTVVGELVDAATGKATGATGHIEFVAEEPIGKVEVTMPVSVHAVPGAQLVVFERAYDETGQLVATHADLGSSSQTVTIESPPSPTPLPPAPSPEPSMPAPSPTAPPEPEGSPTPATPSPRAEDATWPAPASETASTSPAGSAPPSAAPETQSVAESQQLADTGTDLSRWALLAGSALMVGTGAILLARRARQ